jgi:hypothetical protein
MKAFPDIIFVQYTISDITGIIQADTRLVQDTVVSQLLLDSRKIIDPAHSLFFALSGFRRAVLSSAASSIIHYIPRQISCG